MEFDLAVIFAVTTGFFIALASIANDSKLRAVALGSATVLALTSILLVIDDARFTIQQTITTNRPQHAAIHP